MPRTRLTSHAGESEEAHREVYGQEKHESKLSHELVAGAASFAGMKAWEDHQRKEGMHFDPLPVLTRTLAD